MKNSSAIRFRAADWGDASVDVRRNEQATLIEARGNKLIYEGTLGRWPVTITYRFIDNRFDMGTYALTLDCEALDEYVANFEKLKDLLTTKYGRSAQASRMGIDNDGRSNGEMIMLTTTWRDSEAFVSLQLTPGGGKGKFDLEVVYKANPDAQDASAAIADL